MLTVVGGAQHKSIVYLSERFCVCEASPGARTYFTPTYRLCCWRFRSLANDTIDFTITPASNDLVPVRNQIFEIANTNITVIMQDDAGTGTSTTATTTSSTTTGTTTGSSTTY